jgi:hypothetical protein
MLDEPVVKMAQLVLENSADQEKLEKIQLKRQELAEIPYSPPFPRGIKEVNNDGNR